MTRENMELTIILTLKDRSAFTRRWMRYMNDMKCPYQILIADGGQDKEIEEYLKDDTNFPDLCYKYIRYPYDATVDDFYKKFEDVISRVSTEYILLADNDDFYLLDRIPEHIEFLNTHPDYIGARGQLINFSIFDSNYIEKNAVAGEQYEAVIKESVPLDDNDCFDRVDFLCKNMSRYDYYANWYCVFHTKIFVDTLVKLNSLPIKELLVNEILINVMLVKSGKINVSSKPYIARQNNTSIVGDALIVGNSFLERCLIMNAFSEFGIAIDKFANVQNQEEREKLLKSIAAWLEITVSNIHTHNKKVGKFKSRLRKKIRKIPLGMKMERVYTYLSHLWLPVSKRKSIRMHTIERYITI